MDHPCWTLAKTYYDTCLGIGCCLVWKQTGCYESLFCSLIIWSVSLWVCGVCGSYALSVWVSLCVCVCGWSPFRMHSAWVHISGHVVFSKGFSVLSQFNSKSSSSELNAKGFPVVCFRDLDRSHCGPLLSVLQTFVLLLSKVWVVKSSGVNRIVGLCCGVSKWVSWSFFVLWTWQLSFCEVCVPCSATVVMFVLVFVQFWKDIREASRRRHRLGLLVQKAVRRRRRLWEEMYCCLLWLSWVWTDWVIFNLLLLVVSLLHVG